MIKTYVMLMRKITIVCVTLAVSLFANAALAVTSGPHISVDIKSGRVLEHHKAFQKWYPASLTKLMTTYVVFRAIQDKKITLNSEVTMSRYAASKPASKMYFPIGTAFTMDSALKYLLVKSANDVAVAIGEAVAGSEKNFIAMMNSEAKRIGMNSTKFVNPNGLPGKGQYTTAHDMAVLGLALHKEFPKYKNYFNIGGFSTGTKNFRNYNLLLGRFEGMTGMKTGYICSSGFNLVSSAKRGNTSILAVTLGARSQVDRAELSAKLLDNGFKGKTKKGPKLSRLKPYGENREKLVDIRPEICSKEGSKYRVSQRDGQGRLKFTSPLLSKGEVKPTYVAAPFFAPISPAEQLKKLNYIPIPAIGQERANLDVTGQNSDFDNTIKSSTLAQDESLLADDTLQSVTLETKTQPQQVKIENAVATEQSVKEAIAIFNSKPTTAPTPTVAPKTAAEADKTIPVPASAFSIIASDQDRLNTTIPIPVLR